MKVYVVKMSTLDEGLICDTAQDDYVQNALDPGAVFATLEAAKAECLAMAQAELAELQSEIDDSAATISKWYMTDSSGTRHELILLDTSVWRITELELLV
jgi:hypothetical protein